MNQEALQILIMVNNHRGDMEQTTSEAGIYRIWQLLGNTNLECLHVYDLLEFPGKQW